MISKIPSQWARRYTSINQSIADSGGTRLEFVGNGSHAHAALVHGDHVCINNLAPQCRFVVSGMAGMTRQFEILDSIVRLDPVDVMNNLVRQEFALQLTLHDCAMLQDSAPIVKRDSPVSLSVEAACSSSASVVGRESVAPLMKLAEMPSAHPMPVNLDFGLALAVRNQAHG